MANTKLKGYPGPTATGAIEIIFDHDGPASYTTGGETLTAASLGYKNIHTVMCSGSDNGLLMVLPRASVKGITPTIKLVWVTIVGGVEIANAAPLNARFCRIRAIVS